MEALKIGGLAIGTILAVGLLVLAALWSAESRMIHGHDATKLLQLQKECLQDQPNIDCDHYAEKHSRIVR